MYFVYTIINNIHNTCLCVSPLAKESYCQRNNFTNIIHLVDFLPEKSRPLVKVEKKCDFVTSTLFPKITLKNLAVSKTLSIFAADKTKG